ncbi:unnamed protein product [Linum trigynum]|uniref:Uncharacterized protein n=1 Tax=Linum trigynum TaxID=586398 RepID=A0AAV2GAK5_9ROSI
MRPWRRAIYSRRLVCRSSQEVTPSKWVSRQSILWTRGSPVGGAGGGTGRWSAGRRQRPRAQTGGCSRGGTFGGRGSPSMNRNGPNGPSNRMECKVLSSNPMECPSYVQPAKLTFK